MTGTSGTWRCAARTDTGKVRARNEDAFLALPELGLWIVADGMGGHQNGDLASRLIVERLAELPDFLDLDQQVDWLRSALHGLNRHLAQDLTVHADQPDAIVGSTVVALLARGDQACCLWAGDSRCYMWRGGRLFQLSRDHSFMEELIHDQRMSPAEAARHPSARALTRAIGAHEKLDLDMIRFTVYPGDTLLLCSDGLYQSLLPDTIGAAMNLPSPSLALQRLFNQCLAGPARDNISAVVIRR